jgi:hypothetical protein
LGRGVFDEGLLELAAGITLRYCDASAGNNRQIICGQERLSVNAVDEGLLVKLRI